MASVQSVTCCCLLWLMLSVQLVTPGSPGTAQLSGHRAARVPVPESVRETICPESCGGVNPLEEQCPESCAFKFYGFSCCSKSWRVVTTSIRRRKRSMAV
uniref:Conotoxin n=1 Tax=Conus praecellens TaxID=128530 RepID=A0A291C2E1_CONPC|nr:conotoxin [Conus praecellens]